MSAKSIPPELPPVNGQDVAGRTEISLQETDYRRQMFTGGTMVSRNSEALGHFVGGKNTY